MRLWYTAPAKCWERQALPIGNGRLGAMIFGESDCERIQFNEETLFTGHPAPVDEQAHLQLEPIRALLRGGRYREAQELVETRFLKKSSYGDVSAFGAYQAFAALRIDHEGMGEVSGYCRELDLCEGVASVNFSHAGKNYTREYFASCPDDVLAFQIACDAPGSISLRVTFEPGHENAQIRSEGEMLVLSGQVESLRYEARLLARCEGGSILVADGEIEIRSADCVRLYLTAATDYRIDGPTYLGGDPTAHNRRVLENLGTWETLRKRHVLDYQALFSRVTLELGKEEKGIPTDERLARYRAGSPDNGLEALLFQYGRYLLISSSRPGTLPANLQGIWNDSNDPMWGSMFCYNINLNMNYWPAEVTNLHECHEPMIRFIDRLRESGRRSAGAYFGAHGWCAAKKSDIWGFTQPYADAVNGLFLGGGGWLCQDVWTYYSFSKDLSYLRETGYPILRECAEFYLDYLTESEDGCLISSPSTSPEHCFMWEGAPCSVSDGTEIDHRIIEELFRNCIRASELLGIDADFRDTLRASLLRLAPTREARDGTIREWRRDFDAVDRTHRHLSELYGLYPAQLLPPRLHAAARRTLEARGDGSKGWSRAWKIALWARLRDGSRAHSVLQKMLQDKIYENLFDTHPPFQIDGNFGYTAAVAEMLLQSTEDGVITLLPALPDAWPEGRVTGLRARGNITVDIAWSNGRLTGAALYGEPGQSVEVNHIRRTIGADGTCIIRA